jgi:hypothetical protein
LSKANLLRHATEFQHRPYACECGGQYSRLDVPNRHLNTFAIYEPKFPCTFCRLHRGPDGFRRADHLAQHLTNYHNHESERKVRSSWYNFPVCPHPNCPQHRDESFTKLLLRMQQGRNPFPFNLRLPSICGMSTTNPNFLVMYLDVSVLGEKGYSRQKDLKKHREDTHPNSAPYVITRQSPFVKCHHCGYIFASSQSLAQHQLLNWIGAGLVRRGVFYVNQAIS